MPRTATIDPQEVVKGFRDGKFKYGSEAAREFGCSRVRIHQILSEHAPDLKIGRNVKEKSKAEQKRLEARQKKMKAETERALKKHPSLAAAARSLGLTESGLQNRVRRFNIENPHALV